MDFHSLSRRELQALCKRNKIPANITNAAMAEALKALDIVEGIEEVMQPSQSGTAQSSIESQEMPDATSPFVPPTAGRSTRRTNIAKEVPESVNPTTRTRRTTRKTQVKDADAVETPAALMAQTNRKKGQVASARWNMDFQLKECVDEDKKDFLVTPAPMGDTSRRRRLDESAVKKEYSTRRSVRLAEKNNVEIANEVENEESRIFKKEFVAKDGDNVEMNLKDGVDNFNELSGITDVDAITTVEESEVVSIGKDESEVVSDQKQDTSIGDEIKMGNSYAEEEECTNFEIEAKLEEVKCDNEEDMPLNVSNEVHQQNDGSQDVYISEIEITVEKITEELKPEEGEASQDEVADFVENVILENGENFVVDESSCDDTGFDGDIKEEIGVSKDVTELNVTLVKLTELTLQQASQEPDSDFIEHWQLNENELNEIESEKAADQVETDDPQSDEDVEIFEGLENEPNEIEILQLEESEKAADQSDDSCVEFSEQIPKSGLDVEISQPSGSGVEGGLDSRVIVQPTCLIPSKNSESMTMKRMTGFSDNKENIGSGGKLVIMRDVKTAKKSVDNLDELSMRKLCKMLKEKLEITKKLSKNEAMPRPALQVLPVNRLVDDTLGGLAPPSH